MHDAPKPPWTILIIASVVLSLCMGLRNSFGLFLAPTASDIGMTTGVFGLALAVQNLVWGLAQPFLGAWADRMGTRFVLVVSALVYAAGLVLMASASQILLGFGIGGGLLVGIGVAGTGFGTLMDAVTRAVAPERRSWAVGLVAAAGSLGTIVIAPRGQFLIGHEGWRFALVIFALVAVLMALLGTAIRAPLAQAHQVQSGQSLKHALVEAFSHPGFDMMMVAFFACGFQLTFIATHLPGYLAYCGLPPAVGALALALIGLFNAAGSYAVGLLGTRYDKSYLLAGIYLMRTFGVIAFLAVPISTVSTLVFASLMGLLWLSVAPLVSGLIGQLFGLKHFNTLFGVIFLSHQLGSFAGAWLGGAMKDLTGSYTLPWVSMVVVGSLAFALQWGMDSRPSPSPAT